MAPHELSRETPPTLQRVKAAMSQQELCEDDSLTEHSEDGMAGPPPVLSVKDNTDSSDIEGQPEVRAGKADPSSMLSSRLVPSEDERGSDIGNPEPSSDLSPPRPSKKAKKGAQISEDSDEDSEIERKRRIARLKSSSSRGAKQPLKRGGRRF